MTEEIPQAHPTDYKGIRFRSKCEAIFYRNLELGGWLVEYEPKYWIADGWSFDFLAVRKSNGGGILNLLIEYKPTKPTLAYLQRHDLRIRSLGVALTGFQNAVCVGSPYNSERKTLRFLYPGTRAWVDCESAVRIFDCIDEAAKHRFDLL